MIHFTDEQFFKFAKQADMSGDLLKQYEDYMKKAGKATSAFGTTLKSIGANLGIMLAITVAVQALSAAWDYLNVTLEEQQEIIDGLKTDIEGLKIEYDELNGKGNLSAQEQEKLKMLERQLAIQNELYQIELKRLAESDLEGKGDLFSTGNLEHINIKDGKDTYAGTLANDVDNLIEKLDTYRSKLNETNMSTWGARGLADMEKDTVENLEKQREKVLEQWQQYSDSYTLIQKYMDMGVWDDDADQKAHWEGMLNQYEIGMQNLQDIADKIDLQLGVEIDVDTAKKYLTKELKNAGKYDADWLDSLSDEEIQYLFRIEDIGKYSPEDLKDMISDLREEAEEPIEVEITTADILTNLEDDLSEGFEKIAEIYNDVADAGDFDFGNLSKNSDFGAIFGETEGFNEFIETVSKSPSNINACQDAFDKLVTSWFYAKSPLHDINEENKQSIINWMKSKGVINAEAVATYALAKKKDDAFFATKNLIGASADQINTWIAEAQQAGLTKTAIYQLELALVSANDTKLDFSQQIAKIHEIATEAGVATVSLTAMNTAMNNKVNTLVAQKTGVALRRGGTRADVNANQENWTAAAQQQAIKDETQKVLKQIQDNAREAVGAIDGYKAPSGSGGGGSSGSSKDPHIAEVDKYKELSDAVEDVETKLKHLDQVYEHTDTGVFITTISDDIIQKLNDATENLESEYQKIQDWGLGAFETQIKNGTVQSVFGNVDMDKRTIIKWSDELKKTYKEELASWDYDPEINSVDTVFGGSGRFGENLNGIGWEVAYTPILPDGTFLNKNTITEYIENILSEAYKTDGKVTESELRTIDAQGRQIGDTFVNGVFAAVDDSMNYNNNGNWAETVGRLMHFSGNFGAVNLAEKELNALKTITASTTKYISKIDKQIALKREEINLYKEQQEAITALNNARDQEIQEKVNKLRGQGFQIDYDPKSDYLLIKNREHINNLNQNIIEEYEDYISTVDDLNDANKESAEQWTELMWSIVDTGNAITELEFKKYEQYVKEQEHLIELLSNREDTVGLDLPIYDNMMTETFNEWKKLVADGYEKNKDQIQDLEKQWMEYYDARIEREKEILEMQLDDNDKALDGVINLLEDESKAIEDQIDALQSANDERKEALELQKAQAALDKARNQKTRLVLRKGQGWVWESDQDEIQSAEEDVADKEFDATISSLEKQKEALEEIKEMWSEIPEIYDKEQAKLMASELLGANWEEQVLNGRLDIYEDFKDDYVGIQEEIQDKTDELEKHLNESYLQMMKIFEGLARIYGTDLSPVESNVSSQYTLGSGNKAWYVQSNGKAPDGAKVGDVILTRGGTYKITSQDENGKFTSEKLDDISSNITSAMWGTIAADSTDELVAMLGINTDASEEIVRAAEETTGQIKNNILTTNGWSKVIADNTSLTQDEVDAIFENVDMTDLLSDYTDDNTDATDENTRAILAFIQSLSELEIPVEEVMTLENFDDSIMDETDQAYIKELQRAWNLAMEQGNIELANQIHAMADEARLRYLDDDPDNDYNAIAKEFAKLDDSVYEVTSVKQIGGSNADSEATEAYLNNLNWLREKSEGYASEEFMNRLDAVEDAIVNGSGLTQKTSTDQYGRTSTVIDYTDKSSVSSSSSKSESSKKTDMSDSDKQAIKDAQTAYNEAKAKGDTEGMAKAHEAAEAIRNANGYSGGVDGSQVIATSNDKVVKANKESADASTYAGDSSNYAGDASYDAADSIKETGDKVVSGVSDAVSNIKVSVSGSSSSGGSSSSKSSSSSSSSKSGQVTSGNTTTTYNGSVTVVSTKNSDGSTSHTVKDSSTGRVIGTSTTKAKGGLNLPEDNYIVNEKGDEAIIEPDEGNWIRLHSGSSVIPHEASKNMWEFGENPKMFLSDVLGYDAMKMNQQIVYTGGNGGKTVTNHYEIANVSLPNVTKPQEFWDEFTRNLPNEAKQWSSTGY